jgi:uncharacterized protein YcbK (DUF882 family)
MKLSKNFRLSEFTCKCGCGFDVVSAELVAVLQDVADHFGGSVIINSACRCESHNEAVGGGKTSQHLLGTAADIKVMLSPGQLSATDVYTYLCSKYPVKYGVGSYNGFTHIDVRNKAARWAGN